MTEYLTVKHVATRLGVTVHFIYGEIRNGRLQAIKLGKKVYRIAVIDFDAYIMQQRRQNIL